MRKEYAIEDAEQMVEEPDGGYVRNSQLDAVYNIVEETGENLFLTGKAGTGKTTFLHRLRERSSKRMVVLAPTGVAAINAGGVTIHSFFQFPFSPFIPGQGFVGEKRYNRLSQQKQRLIRGLNLIVIDEISMVRPDLLDAIDDFLRRVRHNPAPFGGVQLLMIGDLRQLAPVVCDAEKQTLEQYYSSPFFFDSKALASAGFMTVELTKVYRQTDDRFLYLLENVREGHASPEVLAMLNSRYNPTFMPPDGEGYIRLTTHNRLAAKVNDSKLLAIDKPEMHYRAKISGDFPENSYPADSELILKEGAQVMFIKNDTGLERRFYNGMIGHVRALTPDAVYVEPVAGGEIIKTERMVWENVGYEIDEKTQKIETKVKGVFSQIPLRTAWAITIHKSQGLTFDRAIIDAGQSFAPGQAYVALSRCRSLQGLVLGSRLTESSIFADGSVTEFMRRSECDARVALEDMKARYCSRLLAEMFTFSSLKQLFNDLYRSVEEFVVPVNPDSHAYYVAMRLGMNEKLEQVGDKFCALYTKHPVRESEVDVKTSLGRKITDGCRYFSDILRHICAMVAETPFELKNARNTNKLKKSAQRFLEEAAVKLFVLDNIAETGFSPTAYIDFRTQALLKAEEGSLSKVIGKKIKKEKRV